LNRRRFQSDLHEFPRAAREHDLSTTVSTIARSELTKAHCLVIDAGNKNVYVPVLGGDIVMKLKFDPTPAGYLQTGRARSPPRRAPVHAT
jgi:hypothetical protein